MKYDVYFNNPNRFCDCKGARSQRNSLLIDTTITKLPTAVTTRQQSQQKISAETRSNKSTIYFKILN